MENQHPQPPQTTACGGTTKTAQTTKKTLIDTTKTNTPFHFQHMITLPPPLPSTQNIQEKKRKST